MSFDMSFEKNNTKLLNRVENEHSSDKKKNTFINEMYSDHEETCIQPGESYHKHREESPESPLNHGQQRLSTESRAITQQGFRSNTHFKRLPHLKERPELSGLSRLVWDAGELT